MLVRGLAFMAAGELEKAAVVLREALRLNPDCQPAMQLLKKTVKPVAALLEEARDFTRKLRWAQAEEAYSQLLARFFESDFEQPPAGAAADQSAPATAIFAVNQQALRRSNLRALEWNVEWCVRVPILPTIFC